jgi:hypothetical protein
VRPFVNIADARGDPRARRHGELVGVDSVSLSPVHPLPSQVTFIATLSSSPVLGEGDGTGAAR